ncbi:hypothetical protein LR48_Vigan01g299500 [Vigna angularis]|uniref:Uncharacterized protein n=1 Tax=Phaseolus angularis TaxID=3914 RepID=A0A0L9TTG8_PHAAN|nr:uncharacterized protein LOC108340535 [Vigna angularis]KAG2407295.1 uncharacterized protein HKW66_Vig0021170 [Vigna angularis]KOM33439.1 hypothetical protein LR48_Vigan01g299500 [Vigna angularis]
MAGIASGISKLAVGPGDARRRSLQPQTTPDNNPDANNPDANNPDTNNVDTNKTDTNTTSNTDSSSNSESSEEFGYVNSAKQDIKGLTNLTGYVKGNANGVINFGTLRASDPRVQP